MLAGDVVTGVERVSVARYSSTAAPASGVTDHYAVVNSHALHLARRVVANLNYVNNPGVTTVDVDEPLYDPADLGGIVGTDFDMMSSKPILMAENCS